MMVMTTSLNNRSQLDDNDYDLLPFVKLVKRF